MVASLDLFYKFYQSPESVIDLCQDKNKYLFPQDHKDFAKVTRSAHSLYAEKILPSFLREKEIFKIEKTSWLIRKTEANHSHIPHAPTGPASSNVLRVVMNEKLKEMIASHHLPVILPQEYLFTKPQPTPTQTYRDFYVISQRLEILDKKAILRTFHEWEPEQQKECAQTICKLIYYSGYMDAHLDNIVLNNHQTLCVVDTEGHSLFHDSHEKYSPLPLHEARIIGLKRFIEEAQENSLPPIFIQTARAYLTSARLMKCLFYTKIFLSILCPLIPLVVLVISVVNSKFSKGLFKETPALDFSDKRLASAV